MTKTSSFTRWLLAAAVALSAGCAQNVGDINRVQPNVLKKSDILDGTWYFRNTVTSTPATTGFTFPGQTGAMEKLVWEIQENSLIGYRAYPYILGIEANIDPSSKVSGTTTRSCDDKGVCRGGQKYYGAPVVAYAIISQFDIQRNYNFATGEQGNVISENATDRVWNQREYIRVNWSANILNRNSGLSFGTIGNATSGSSQSQWIQPNEKGADPYDWPRFEYDADGKLKYMDVTATYMANPDLYYFEDYGYYPLCYLSNNYDCTSAEIRVRTSISKIDPKSTQDYEPLLYDNALMAKFGYFRTERLNYDRRFGYLDSAVVRLANRHRTWEKYYENDASGAPDPSKPIALDKRTQKPIVYYFTPADRMGGVENEQRYLVPAKTMETNWDRAFRKATALAKNQTPEQVGQMFYVCQTPVPEGAPAACGEKGFKPRFGDLRYNWVNTVAEPVANGLLGYGPSSADPETGEIISANANTYLWGVDLYGQSTLDLIDLLTGAVSTNDFISGKSMKEYVKSNPNYARGEFKPGTKIKSALSGLSTKPDRSTGAFDRPTPRMANVFQKIREVGGITQVKGDLSKSVADVLAQNPQLESVILDNPDFANDIEAMLPAGLVKAANGDKAMLRAMSRRMLTDVGGAQAFLNAREKFLSENCVYNADFTDRTLLELANSESDRRTARVAELKGAPQAACPNPAGAPGSCTDTQALAIANREIKTRISQSVWLATTAHEVGHTLGLRHNFQASFDAVNYFDEYWNIRKDSLTVDDNGTAKVPRALGDLKSVADATELQKIKGLYNYEYSSIMDYSGKTNGDWQGTGRYDDAAIVFVYSGGKEPGFVETFKAARSTPQSFPGSDGNTVSYTGAQRDLPIVNAQHIHPGIKNYTERYHYSNVPMHFGEGADLSTVISDGIAKLRDRKWLKYSDVKAQMKAVADAVDADPTLAFDPDRAAAVTAGAPLEVPYMYCSDEHAGSILSCARFDRGPDYYEISRQNQEDYWAYYYTSHFRRDRANFSSNRAFNGALGNFLDVAKTFKWWVYEFYGKTSTAQEPRRNAAPIDATMQDYWTMAVFDGVNAHINVMSVPAAGYYMLRNLGTGPRWDVISEGDDFDQLNEAGKKVLRDYYGSDDRGTAKAQAFVELPRGLGRRMYSRYDFRNGFGFFNRVVEVGHYNDQLGALFAAVIPSFDVLGADDNADFNRFTLPYYLVFNDEFGAAFGALWSQKEDYVRPTLSFALDEGGNVLDGKEGRATKAALANRRFVYGDTFVQQFAYPPALDTVCSGGQTTNCILPTQSPAPANIQLTWTSRIYSLFLGLAYFRTNYDLDYARANQVFKLGAGEQQTIAPGYEAVEVQDIGAGGRYVAIQKVGAPIDSTPAVTSVNWAKDYLVMVKDPTTNPVPERLRPFYAPMSPQAAANPSLVEDQRKTYNNAYRDAIRDLDLIRGMYQAFGKAF